MSEKEFENRFGEYNGPFPSVDYKVYEGKIKRAVIEAIDKLIDEKGILLEFYGNRKDFYRLVYNNVEQLFQNYCLIKYGELKGLRTVHHWWGEYLRGIEKIYNYQVKENNSPKYRFKLINGAFQDRLEKFDKMAKTFRNTKLVEENIDPNDEEMLEIIESFPKKVMTIVLHLAHIKDERENLI